MQTDPYNRVYYGDSRVSLPRLIEAGIRCNAVVTSPPYLGLRSYLDNNDENKGLEIGNEQAVDEYITNLVHIFNLCRELLYDDGTLWVVISDSYAGSGGIGGQHTGKQPKYSGVKAHGDIKPKDLCLVPSHLAIAMRKTGWWVRCDVVWHKPSCLPPWAPDRPLRDHESIYGFSKSEEFYEDYENVWMFSKSADPYYDQHAVKKPINAETLARYQRDQRGGLKTQTVPGQNISTRAKKGIHVYNEAGANLRTVWSINPEPLKDAHFAAFPSKLASRLIRLSTSEYGHCPSCGRGWKRVIEKGEPDEEHRKLCGADSQGEYHGESQKDYLTAKAQDASATKARILKSLVVKRTVSWEPECECGLDPVPAIILDPFMGSGTVAQCAESLNRNRIGCELNEADYRPLIEKRIAVGHEKGRQVNWFKGWGTYWLKNWHPDIKATHDHRLLDGREWSELPSEED
jgi:site-specific DNA-methyltransferase (cytosine-N4-specific)